MRPVDNFMASNGYSFVELSWETEQLSDSDPDSDGDFRCENADTDPEEVISEMEELETAECEP